MQADRDDNASHAHAVPGAEVLRKLAAEAGPLSVQEAARRLTAHGPNQLPKPPKPSPVLRFLSHFYNVLIYVLLASVVVTAALAPWVDTGMILAVVIVNATIGFLQEGRAEQAMAAIRGMLAPHSAVLRDGRRVSVDAADLVPGDIVRIEAGDRVPADLRLIEARGLKAEEAILTGESVPVDKGTVPVSEDAALGDRTSVLFSGADAWRSWLMRAVAGEPAQMPIMYGVAGESHLLEWRVSWLDGFRGSRPMRVGNAAAEQFQIDVYGEVADMLLQTRSWLSADSSGAPR